MTDFETIRKPHQGLYDEMIQTVLQKLISPRVTDDGGDDDHDGYEEQEIKMIIWQIALNSLFFVFLGAMWCVFKKKDKMED